MCCNVLQCVAVCCSELWCDAVCCSVLQCDAVCCSVMPCDAVCCSDVEKKSAQHFRVYVVLQCDVVWCSVLRCVAATFSRLQTRCISWLNKKKSAQHFRVYVVLQDACVWEREGERECNKKAKQSHRRREATEQCSFTYAALFSSLWKEPLTLKKKVWRLWGENAEEKICISYCSVSHGGKKAFQKKRGFLSFSVERNFIF